MFFNIFWIEEEILKDNQFVIQLIELGPNALKMLIEGAKKTNICNIKGHPLVYTSIANSTLYNKRAYWYKVAKGSNNLKDWLTKTVDTIDEIEVNTANIDITEPLLLTFDNNMNSNY